MLGKTELGEMATILLRDEIARRVFAAMRVGRFFAQALKRAGEYSTRRGAGNVEISGMGRSAVAARAAREIDDPSSATCCNRRVEARRAEASARARVVSVTASPIEASGADITGQRQHSRAASLTPPCATGRSRSPCVPRCSSRRSRYPKSTTGARSAKAGVFVGEGVRQPAITPRVLYRHRCSVSVRRSARKARLQQHLRVAKEASAFQPPPRVERGFARLDATRPTSVALPALSGGRLAARRRSEPSRRCRRPERPADCGRKCEGLAAD